MNRNRSTHVEVNLTHLKHNFLVLKSFLQDTDFICPMIKANAYGHGDIQCAGELRRAGSSYLGVALIEEGIRLRTEGDEGGILVFGTYNRNSISEAIKFNLTPVLSRWSDIKELEDQLPTGSTYPVHIKMNTGMNRLGFSVEETERLSIHFNQSSSLNLTGICTHLLNAEDSRLSDGRTAQQISLFEKSVHTFDSKKAFYHALNSQALCSKSFIGLGARPGIALYGYLPATLDVPSPDLRPVLTWLSQIEHLHHVRRGDTVSYGGYFLAERDSLIGVIPCGYADGYPRSASNQSEVIVRSKRVRTVGTVCMDYIMVDLTDLCGGDESSLVGEEVILLGTSGDPRVSVDAAELARVCKTIPYEILTGISGRVPRVYVH